MFHEEEKILESLLQKKFKRLFGIYIYIYIYIYIDDSGCITILFCNVCLNSWPVNNLSFAHFYSIAYQISAEIRSKILSL